MIYTVTFNPSIDYVVAVNSLQLGRVNRTDAEQIYPGGKGINVSIVLQNLGIENKAFGFLSGFTGNMIQSSLEALHCNCDFVSVKNGFSRINVKLQADQETEINGQGPIISANELEEFFIKLDQIQDGDILVLAGSIPTCLPSNIYETIMKRLATKDIRFVVDATKDLLLNTLKYHPFLIKPNNHELEEIFQTKIHTNDKLIHFAKELQKLGAQNVLVSMAGDGALLVDSTGNASFSPAANGNVKNSVGAGDSMVAGFIAGYIQSNNYISALKMGIATGGASAFSDTLATKVEVDQILKTL